jgi:excisionase family DNA binding protein
MNSDTFRVPDHLVKHPSPWMTKQEAADYLRVHVHTIDDYIAKGFLTRYHIGDLQSTRLKRSEIEALMQPSE